jgi:hypothetical protein
MAFGKFKIKEPPVPVISKTYRTTRFHGKKNPQFSRQLFFLIFVGNHGI